MLTVEKREELQAFLDTRTSGLDEAQSRQVITDFFSYNIIDFGDLGYTGMERLFTNDELEEYEEKRDWEDFAENPAAMESWHDVAKSQKRFRAEEQRKRAKQAHEDKKTNARAGIARGLPRTSREFESFLRESGFSKRQATKISSQGFQAAAGR